MQRTDEPGPPTWDEILEAVLAFTFLSILFSWPLIRRFGSEIPRSAQPGDPVHIFYGLITGARNLLDHPLRFYDATFYYPYPLSLSFLDQIFGLSLLAAPVLALSRSMIASYNTVWLLTFILSGVGAFALVRTLTGSRAGGLLAGILYAFHPLRFHSEGILHAVAMMWIPFALLSLHRWMISERRRHLVFFALFSLIQFLSSGYTGVFLLFALVLYVAVRTAGDPRETLAFLRRERWAILAVGLGSLLVLTPLVAPAISNLRASMGLHRSLGESALYSALPADFLTPAPESVLAPYAPFAAGARHPLFPGAVAVFLALAWIVRGGWLGESSRLEFLFYLALAGLSAILALGPALVVSGTRVPLPFALFYYVFPGAALVRAPVRFAVLFSLGVAVLAGAGLARLGRGGTGFRSFPRWGTVLLLGLALIELYPGPLVLFDPWGGRIPAVYHDLARSPAPLVLAEFPMAVDEEHESVDEARYQLYSLIHGKRLVNGVAAYVPPEIRTLRLAVQGFPDRESIDALERIGVDRVLIHTRRYPLQEMRNLRYRVSAFPELKPLVEKDGVWLLALAGNPAE